MSQSVKRILLSVAFIVIVAISFMAGAQWDARYGSSNSGESCGHEAAAPSSMDACPMVGMNHGATAASMKNAAGSTPVKPVSADACPMMGMNQGAMASSDGCSMEGMDCGSMEAKTPQPSDSYPLDTCPVTGKKLGTMGEPVIKKYEGREVRFCCGGCPAKFEQDLQANLKKLDAAIAKAKDAKISAKSNIDTVSQSQRLSSQSAPMAVHQGHATMH